MELKICHLYPDVLNLYGDQGNILCMKRRLNWRGIDVQVTQVPIGAELKAADHDLFFMGGGQEFEQDILLNDLMGAKAAEIRAAIEDGKTFLAINGGYQMLGNYYKSVDGKQTDFIGALNLHTEGSKDRFVGNYMFTCDELEGLKVVGFEHHAGRTWLGEGVRPLGKVLVGNGNNGKDGTEGTRYKNVFASYSHGCLLPKNPVLADHILKITLEHKYGKVDLAPLDDALELSAHSYMQKRLESK